MCPDGPKRKEMIERKKNQKSKYDGKNININLILHKYPYQTLETMLQKVRRFMKKHILLKIQPL